MERKNLMVQKMNAYFTVKRFCLILMVFFSVSGQAESYDKLTHFAVSYGISYTGMHLLPPGSRWLSPVLTLALGAVKELTDKQSDRNDMIANGLGVATSIVVFTFE